MDGGRAVGRRECDGIGELRGREADMARVVDAIPRRGLVKVSVRLKQEPRQNVGNKMAARSHLEARRMAVDNPIAVAPQ